MRVNGITVESYGISDIGYVRKSNEDAWAAIPSCTFYVLADGMGGHQAGEVASEEAVQTLSKEIQKLSPKTSSSDAEISLKKMIEQVNQKIYHLSHKNPAYAGMGTTLACLWIYDEKLTLAHVGDSRIYRFRKKQLSQLTEDHSLRQELISKGELDEESSRVFKNILTRAIGTQSQVVPSIKTYDLENEDIYFLCSDGLTDEITPEEMESILLKSKTIKEASDSLVGAAKAGGGSDNITIVMVKILKP